MRALEFINEEKIGVKPKRQGRAGARPDRGHTAEPRYKDKSVDVAVDESGKASKELCLSNKKKGASDLSSCKSQGFIAHKTSKTQKIGKKRVKLDGKKIKGKQYGGPLPDYS